MYTHPLAFSKLRAMEEVPLIDQSSGENVSLSDLEKGDSVRVPLVEHAPTTMSLPPQIPGMGIVQVELVE